MNKPNIKVILGSIREGRVGKQVAQWFMGVAKNNPNVNVELLDLVDYPLPLFADSNAVRNREGKHPIPEAQKWLDKIEEADGFIIITPEYNHSYSSALKNALDYGNLVWADKPVGFVSYGGFAGGARAVEHLRGVVAELRMHDVRDQVVIPTVWTAFDAEGSLANAEMHTKNANAILDKVADLSVRLTMPIHELVHSI